MCPVIWWASRKEKTARFLETVILCEAFRGNFKRKLGSSLCYHTISVLTCLCACISLIFRFFYLAYYCIHAMLFSVSHLSNSEHLLLLVLYAWCLPKISHVMFLLRLLSFIFQNSLDSSVSDLRFLRLNNFLWFAYLCNIGFWILSYWGNVFLVKNVIPETFLLQGTLWCIDAVASSSTNSWWRVWYFSVVCVYYWFCIW